MVDLNENLIETKNLLNSSDVWTDLMHVAILNGPNLRIACNADKDVVWNGFKWTALQVEVGVVREDQEEVPQVEVKISNITRIPESYAEAYDGFTGSAITIYEVNTANLNEVDDVKSLKLEVVDSSFDMYWASFRVGVNPNPFTVNDPDEDMLKNFCRFNFPNSVDSRCPYTGVTYTACNKSLAHCIQRLGVTGSVSFGGFPALGTNKLYVD